jgi:hypothetical protein
MEGRTSKLPSVSLSVCVFPAPWTNNLEQQKRSQPDKGPR